MVAYDRCMGAGHGHGSGHAGTRHRWRLGVAFALVGVFFVVELAVGLWSGSLALLSDAGHMAADVVALGAALAATRIADPANREEVLAGARALLRESHGIDHATVQVETHARSCEELSW